MSDAAIRFDLADWCRLLAHNCTIYDCGCDCHRRRAPRSSTALHRPIHSGENAR